MSKQWKWSATHLLVAHQTQPGEWVVLRSGSAVGRIYRRKHLKWMVHPRGGALSGPYESCDIALAAFEALVTQ